MNDFNDFNNFIATLELQHFQANELLIGTGEELNEIPPRNMWGNIVPTILILDRLRADLDVPIHLTSVYRAPAYNHLKKGRPRSQHQAFSAADFCAEGVSSERTCEILRQWQGQWFTSPVAIECNRTRVEVPAGNVPYMPLNERENNGGCEFQFNGGIGRYATYVHIDTRGRNGFWSRRPLV